MGRKKKVTASDLNYLDARRSHFADIIQRTSWQPQMTVASSSGGYREWKSHSCVRTLLSQMNRLS